MNDSEWYVCPDCGQDIEVNEGYKAWCEHCNWNIAEEEEQGETGWLRTINRKLDERFSGRLLDEFKYSVTREFPLTKYRLYAYMLALIVHTSTLAILGLAILCFATNSTWLGFLGILLLLLWIAVMLPYRRRLPGRVITKEDYPELHQLIEEIRQQLNALSVHMIRVTEDYNSYILSWKGKRKILVLGIPQLAALTTEEKIAIISFQMSLLAHPNAAKHAFVDRAMNLLQSWQDALDQSDSGILAILLFPLVILGQVVAFFLALFQILLMLTLRDEMQRSIYIADYEASLIAGSQAWKSLLLKATMEEFFLTTAFQVAKYPYSKELYEEFRQRIATIPRKEMLRAERLQEMQEVHNVFNHPSAKNRLEVMREHWCFAPSYQPDAAQVKKIQAEFHDLEQRSQKILLSHLRETG
ncbi:M48 family metallopeptidase [Paenibacillus sp. FSL W8-0426]|uniref:M48 family metallopeptidase n=1 Tax=Paenibacillus sp. FSL W8-0426 TaxID=2921714 RepID=UPI0030DA40E7